MAHTQSETGDGNINFDTMIDTWTALFINPEDPQRELLDTLAVACEKDQRTQLYRGMGRIHADAMLESAQRIFPITEGESAMLPTQEVLPSFAEERVVGLKYTKSSNGTSITWVLEGTPEAVEAGMAKIN